MELAKIREEIDDLDQQIFLLLKKRFDITDLVMDYKDSNNMPRRDNNREKEILSKAKATDERVETIYRDILDISKKEL